MRQSTCSCVKTSDKNVIYPIYEEDIICGGVLGTFGCDMDKLVDKTFEKITPIYTLGKYAFEKMYFLGLGKRSEITTMKLRKAFGTLIKELNEPVLFVAKRAVTDRHSESIRVICGDVPVDKV